MDKVSVIMPVHNAEPFVAFAIRSVLAQTYPEWELFVVDDCSTDNSVAVIREFVRQDSRIHLLTTKKSSGMPGTPRNEGIKEATGRFIAFLDSDDAWLPNKLEEQLRLFDDPQTAIVYGNYEKVAEDGKRSGRLFVAPRMSTYKSLLRGNVIGNLTGVYDTAKVGKRFFRPVHHEDYVLWLSILKEGYVARCTNTVVGLYRVRSQSVSSRKFAILPWQWNIYVNIENTGYPRALFYYMCYAYKAFRKRLI